MTATNNENRSTQWEISVIGRRAGNGARPGTADGESSMVSSAISTNSKSRIFLTTFGGSDAARLKGPGCPTERGAIAAVGVGPCGVADAAAVSRSRPDEPDRLNVGIPLIGSVAGFVEPAPIQPYGEGGKGGARAAPTICVCAGSGASLGKYQTVVYLCVAYSSGSPLSDSLGSSGDGSVNGSCDGCGFARSVDGPPNIAWSHASCSPENGGWSDIPGGEVSHW